MPRAIFNLAITASLWTHLEAKLRGLFNQDTHKRPEIQHKEFKLEQEHNILHLEGVERNQIFKINV
jgi:hypothetical protein